MNKLEQLRTMTTVVADTGDLEAITRLRPTDATTNPSLLLKAAALPEFADEVGSLKASKGAVADKVDRFAVSVGSRINQVIPGVISTEVDARLSFDTEATIAKAQKLMLGHYSARYRELDELLEEAQLEHPQVILGKEGLCVSIESHIEDLLASK